MTTFSLRKPSSCATYRELTDYHNQFQCLICMELLSNPQTLDCKHTFCEGCLIFYGNLFSEPTDSSDDNNSSNSSQHGELACPTCRSTMSSSREGQTDRSANGDSNARNRKISLANETTQRCDACVFRRRVDEADFYCSKCALNFCSGCKSVHDQHVLFKGHVVIHISNKDTFNLYCDEHSKSICIYFCLDCDIPCCTICILHDHRTHKTSKLREALASRRDLLKTKLNDFGPKLDRLEAKINKLSETINGRNATNGGSGDLRKSAMLNGSDAISMSRKSTGGICYHNGENGYKNGFNRTSDVAVRFMSRSNESLDKNSSSTIIESISKQLCHHRKLFMLSTKLLELSQSRKLLAIYQDISSRIQTVLDFELPRMQDEVNDLIVREKISNSQPLGGHQTDPDSCSSISSSGRGRHSSGLSIGSGGTTNIFEDYPSPPSILIRPKLLWKVEKQRSDLGEIWNPCGAAFLSEQGALIVAEYDVMNDKNNKLRIFDKNGKSDSGSVLAHGEIQPLGLAITRDGHVAVTDCKGKKVKILTLNGQTIIDIGKGQFGWPYGIACNSRGQLIVTDAFSDSVSIYQVDGKRIRQFGSSGLKSANFRSPYHVAVDARDNILVSDFGNHCVKVFDTNGKFIFSFSDTGSRRVSTDTVTSNISSDRKKMSRRSLKGPRGVSVDMKGNILVADEYSRVCMFDSAGKYIRNLLTDEDSVKYPEVVHCDRRGLLALTEFNANNMFAIKVFTLYE